MALISMRDSGILKFPSSNALTMVDDRRQDLAWGISKTSNNTRHLACGKGFVEHCGDDSACSLKLHAQHHTQIFQQYRKELIN